MSENQGEMLPGTVPLTMEGDIASHLVDGADRFLLREINRARERRDASWDRDLSSHAAYLDSVQEGRETLARLLGVRDERVATPIPERVSPVGEPEVIGEGDGWEAAEIRWPAFADVTGVGLLLTPKNGKPVADVVAIPDADVLPEHIAGLAEGLPPEQQYGRILADTGCRVVVPAVIDRSEAVNGISNREFLYRSAFELGRHLIGYEIQKVRATLDWFGETGDCPVGVVGWGEGGLLALYTAAVDERVSTACVSGAFQPREGVWREPVERNVFGLLEGFGDAEVAALVAPRSLVVDATAFPAYAVEAGEGKGAPGRLVTPTFEAVSDEFDRARACIEGLDPRPSLHLTGENNVRSVSPEGLAAFTDLLCGAPPAADGGPARVKRAVHSGDRLARQVHETDRHNQWVLSQCAKTRDAYFEALDVSSLEAFQASIEPYREAFAEDVVGRFDHDRLPFNARSRQVYDEPGWTGYEVVLDVFPDLIAYGILGVPDTLNVESGERRPVVVCQHGLEGRPQRVFENSRDAYRDWGAALCREGFIVFAPQNLYLFADRFRSLQRKAYPLKKTLFSMIVPQHQQITDWLKTLPFIDGDRIAFYGISYGGKTAMRVPPLVDNYCLSICSADFNEWVWKNVSTDNDYSYAPKGEYEIFEWDLGSTFNYAEMAKLICPRPFMVERGHDDGVAPDETVAYEYAKVKRFYDRLGIGDRTEMEVFDGGHEIHLEGTLAFLRHHLRWPDRKAQDGD